MNITKPQLNAAIQQTLGALVLQAVPTSTEAQVARAQVGSNAPLVGGADARAVIEELKLSLGLKSEAELATITQEQCLAKAGSAVEGMALFALVVVIQAHLACEETKPSGVLPAKKEPLPTLDVKAYAGNYEQPQAPRRCDPLVLVMNNVAPSTPDKPVKIYLINRSDLDAKPIELPGSTEKAKDGAYSFVADGNWMQEHGIKAGAVLELVQAKLDADGKPTRKSKGTVVKVNPGGAQLIGAPSLPPGDVIGNVQQLPNLRLEPDPAPSHVRATRIAAALHGGLLCLEPKGDERAIEPFAKIRLENLSTGVTSGPFEVGADGGFAASIAACKNDAIVVHIADHSHNLEDPLFERILSLRAGLESEPLLAVNPALGIDGPPSMALGRIALVEGKRIVSDRAITAGSIVTLTKEPDAPGEKPKVVRGIAGADGCLSLELPFEVHADDVFDLVVQNPFGGLPKPTDYQTKASAKARLEIGADGSLGLVSSEGRVHAKGSASGDAAVPMIDQTDRVESGTPLLEDAHFQIKSFKLGFRPRDWNTGNGAQISVDSDQRATPQAAVREENGALVVTLHSELRGGWSEPNKDFNLGVGFGSFGGSSWSNNNPQGVNPVRQLLISKPDGAEVPVRFVTAEGKPIAEGKVAAKWTTYTEGGGSIYINAHWGSMSRPVETYKAVGWDLVPGSLVSAS
ncbi:MAG: hypothetical protein U1E65_17970 [Myxococcota bacterium]